MKYLLSALIAFSSLVGGLFVHDTIAPKVGASQSISSLTELTSLSQNDVLPITEASGLTTKKVKWGTATSSMKTVFDPLYSPIFSTSAGLAGLLSDETGSSGGFVRAGSPTITSPVISSLSSLSVGSDATGDIYYRDGSGNFVRLPMPSGSGYYLTGSSTLGLPKWDNNILTNPYNSAMVFNGTSTFNAPTFGANVYVQYLASTTISGLNAPKAVFVATSTNALWMTDASQATTSDFLGFAISNGSNGVTTTVQIDGVVNGLSGLTAGQAYYASTTGVLSSVYNAGTAEIYVGRAVSATQLLLDRKGESWQYLGSASCSISGTGTQYCDTSSVVFSRFAIVQMNVLPLTGGSDNCYITFTISKNPSNNFVNGLLQKQGTNVWTCAMNAQFTSSSSVRFSGGTDYGSGMSSKTQTAYFYR